MVLDTICSQIGMLSLAKASMRLRSAVQVRYLTSRRLCGAFAVSLLVCLHQDKCSTSRAGSLPALAALSLCHIKVLPWSTECKCCAVQVV